MGKDGVREIALDIASLLRDEILLEKEKLKDLSLIEKIDRFIKLMSAIKDNRPSVNLAIPISFDQSKVDRAERVLASPDNVQKLLVEPRRKKEDTGL